MTNWPPTTTNGGGHALSRGQATICAEHPPCLSSTRTPSLSKSVPPGPGTSASTLPGGSFSRPSAFSAMKGIRASWRRATSRKLVASSILFRDVDWDSRVHGHFSMICFEIKRRNGGLSRRVFVAATRVPGIPMPENCPYNYGFVLRSAGSTHQWDSLRQAVGVVWRRLPRGPAPPTSWATGTS